jgi:hypothetical protein
MRTVQPDVADPDFLTNRRLRSSMLLNINGQKPAPNAETINTRIVSIAISSSELSA